MKEEGTLSKNNIDSTNYKKKFYTRTDTINNKKSKILKLNSNKNFSLRETGKNKEKEESYYLYDKQIFEPIYTQIHKNLKDLDEEIKAGKKYILPLKKKQREIFQYKFKKGNSLLDNFTESNSKEKKLAKKSTIKKSLFFKKFSGNINNLHSEVNKKRLIFRNLNLNEVINNKKSDDDRLYIKSYTERNKKNEENQNRFNTDLKINQNISIFPNSPETSSRNIENKFISTNSLINISQINNKTLTNSSLQEKIYRNKTFYVEYDPKWYLKNKLIKTHFEKEVIINPLFQKKIIDDELVLLFDNMKHFQSKFLVNKTLNYDFNKLSKNTKIKINILLEEEIGLFIEISYLLLDHYNMDIQKYISNPIPRITKKEYKKVENEKKEFKINTTTLYESYIFLKVCYDTYKIILINKKDFHININSFEILFQYLDRARYIISKICSELATLYQEPNKDDKKLIEQCMNRIKVNHLKIQTEFQNSNRHIKNNLVYNSKSFSRTRFLKQFNSKYKSKIDCHQKFGLFHSGIDSFNYKGPKKLKLSESQIMNLRINKAFGDKSRNVKLKHFQKFDINSPLVNSLMKYATYKFKSDIISERIKQRFSNSNNNE